MYPFKALVKGSLEFGTQKSYDSMMTHFLKRLELYYKNDIVLKELSFFSEETFSLDVPRILHPCSEKTWKNTAFLFRELRSFAVAGELNIWVTDEKGQLHFEESIVPQGDKMATTEYLRAAKLLSEKGNEAAAIEILNKAIDKYPRYAQAYERRGFAYSRLGRTDDALIDFSKSINFNKNPDAYYGRALVKADLGDLQSATVDFQAAIDNAVPYQPVFWLSRRVKGECHVKLNEIEKAIFELKFVVKRIFKETDPNFAYRKKAWHTYGVALMKNDEKANATIAFQQALLIEQCTIVADLLNRVDTGVIKNTTKTSAKAAKKTRPVLT
jgi:tetratricopeptide (TPR) repeat protein